MSVMFVLRDIMPARMAIPIINLLAAQGEKPVVLAEGKAVGICRENDLPTAAEGTDELTPIGAKTFAMLIGEYRPKAICIGCSTPINWELEAAKLARKIDLPVVALEDIWGALHRLKDFVPDLALVMDELAGRMGPAKQFTIIGDIASTVNPLVPPEKQNEAKRMENIILGGKTVIMIVADHILNALYLTEFVAESVRQESDPGQFVISYSLVHPKLIGTPEGDAVLAPAEELLKGLIVDQFGGLSTDARVVRANITVTAYSTTGRIALHHGRRFVSIWGPEAFQLHQEENNLPSYPLADQNIVPTPIKPQPLSAIDWRRYDQAGAAWIKRSKFRPEVAARSIMDFG